MAMFFSAKDKVTTTQKANIVCDIQCPACKEQHIGKTDRCFVTALINMEVDMINQCFNT